MAFEPLVLHVVKYCSKHFIKRFLANYIEIRDKLDKINEINFYYSASYVFGALP